MTRKPHQPRALLEELEPRILYSADLAAVLGAGIGVGADAHALGSATQEVRLQHTALQAAPAQEIAFVDLGVPDAQTLVAGLAAQRDGGRALEIVTIAAGEDGFAVISHTLQGRHEISAVHLYSHGSPGQAQLGSSMLNHDTALQRAHELAGWGSALTSDADLLIYGCDVAATEAGQALVRDLAALTGADVAASENTTGAAAAGGDWLLERRSGPIEAASALSLDAQQAWQGTLVLLAHEPFVGTGSLQGSTGGSGWANAWSGSGTGIQRQGGTSLASPVGQLDSSGGAAQLQVSGLFSFATATRDLVAPLGADGSTTWLSFLLEPQRVSVSDFLGLQFGSASAKVAFAGYNAGQFILGEVGALTSPAVAGISASEGVDTLLVVRVQHQAGDDTLTLYVNPTPGAASPDSGLSTSINLDLGSYTRVGISGGNGLGSNSARLDEVRIGTTYADVTPFQGPTITSNGGGSSASLSVPENSTAVTTVTATDPNGPATTFSIAGGADAAAFSIGISTGVLVFATAPTYASPQDSGANNVYDVVVQASDGVYTDTQALAVGVLAAAPPPSAVADNYSLREDEVLAAGLGGSWYDAAWAQRQAITFNNASGAQLTDTVVLVTLDSSNADYGRIQNAGQDLRFVTPSGQLLPHQINNWDEAGESQVWVQVPTIGAGSTTERIWMYSGNPTAADGQQAAATWPTAAKAVVHIGFPLADSTTWANTLTQSGTTVVDGQIGTARKFNGSSSWVSLGSDAALDDIFLGGGTVSAWINPSDWGENLAGRIASKADTTFAGTANGNGWNLQLSGETQKLVFEFGFVGNEGQWSTPAGSISLNTWQHVCVVYDNSSTANTPRIFINGAEVTTTLIEVPVGSTTSDAAVPLRIGNQALTTDRAFVGRIDEVRIYDAPLTATQIDAEYRAGTGALVGSVGAAIFPGVLTNDDARGGGAMTAELVSGPAHASSFTLNPDGTFNFMPVANYVGADSFVYSARNATAGSAPVTVSLTITAVPDAPVGTSKTVTTIEDSAYTFSAADFGFTDAADSPPHTLRAVQVTTLPGAGSLTLSGAAVSAGEVVLASSINAGNLKFTPAANANGSGYDSYTFRVQDNGGTANGGADLDPTPRTMTVNVTPVNDAPVGTSQTVTAYEDTALVLKAADFGYTDPADGTANNLQAVKITNLPGKGSLKLAGVAVTGNQLVSATDIAAGRLQYTAAANASGSAYTSLKFTLQDNGGTANNGVDMDSFARTMTIAVTAVNDAPAGTDKTVTTLEDSAYTFAAADFGFSDATDNPANALLSVRITALPTAGSLQLSGAAVAAGQLISAADISAGTLKMTPAAHTNGAGAASFTFQMQDNGGTANGGIDLDPTPNTITVNATAVNDAPVRTAGTVGPFSMPEDAGATSLGLGTLAYAPGPTADESAQTLSYRVTAVPLAAPGTVTLVDGTTAVTANTSYTLAQLQGMKFKPVANASGGPVTLTWTVKDNGGTSNAGIDTLTESLSISVTPVNDAPRGTSSTIILSQDTSRALARNDFGFADASGESNTFAAVRLQAPSAGTLTLAGTAIVAATEVAVAQLDAGLLVFTPVPGASGGGYASVAFQVRDDGGTANGGVDLDPTTRTLSFNVTASGTANSPPTFTSPTAASLAEGSTVVQTLTATDAVGQAVSFSIAGGADGALFTIVGGNQLFFVSAPDHEAPLDSGADNVYQVQVRATDSDGASTLQSIAVTVTNINDRPVLALPINDQSVTQGTAYAYTVPAGTFVDPDGDSLLHIANLSPNLALPAWLSFNAGTLTFSGTPGQADVGAVTLRLWAVDPDDTFATSDFTLNVVEVNDAPVITSQGGGPTAAISTAENSAVVTTVAASDIDRPVQLLQYAVSGGADAALFNIDAISGVLRFIAAPDHEAPLDAGADNVYELTVQVSDGQLTHSQSLRVTVTPVNESAPVITSNGGAGTASVLVAENTTAVTRVTATDADWPAAALTYSIAGGADAAAFRIDGSTGLLTFATAPDFELPTDAGADNSYFVTVGVSDGLLSTTQELRVSITDVGGPLVVSTTADVMDGNVSSIEALIANPGADGLISLREAIRAANQTTGADTIVLGAGNHGIAIAPDGTGDDNLDGDFDVVGSLTLSGAGASSTVVDGKGLDRVFHLLPGANLAVSGVTVRGALLAANAYGGGFYVEAGATLSPSGVTVTANQAGSGAGIYNLGTLTAVDTTISNNVAPNWGGGLYNDRGSVSLDRVTLSGNTAGKDGGGINSVGSGAALGLKNVTLSGNTASGLGGGLYSNRAVTINSSSIVFNTASSGAAGLHMQGGGSATLSNTLLYNPAGTDSNSVLVSAGHNLDSDGSAGLAGSGDISGTSGAPIDPNLGALQDNGGATLTHALLAGSAAIDAGNTATAPATDQRGAARVGNVDIGAYEVAAAVSRAPVNTVPGAQSVLEDTVTLISGLSATDPDNGAGLSQNELSTTTLSVAHGTLLVTLVGNSAVSAGASGSNWLTLSGDSAGINATLATLRYLGNADRVGSDTLSVTSRDGVGLSDTDTVALNVTAVNDPPKGTDNSLTLAASGSLVLTRADFGYSDATGENNRFASVLLQLPSQGTLRLAGLVLSAATEVTVAQLDAGQLAFAPAPGATSGPHATLNFQVRDDGGTASAGVDLDATPATLSLAITNNAPVIAAPGLAPRLTLTQPEGRTPVVTLVATDPDASAVLTYSLAGGADAALFSIDATRGALRFITAPDFENPLDADADNVYQVVVQVSDGGLADTAAITVVITDVEHRLDVTTTVDVLDGDTSSIDALWARPGADGLVSLREALIAANQTPGLDTIGFDIAAPLVAGAHTMQLASTLPDVVSPVFIDGRSESDFAGTPVIELDGQGLLSHGVRLAAGSDGSTVQGLVINRFTGDAVLVVGSNLHTLAGNFLGTDVTGHYARGNGGAGIWASGSSITIGGTTALDANLIAGSGSAGVWLDGGADNIVIAGNRFGIGLGGEALGNFRGIHLGSGVHGVRIGGTAAGAGNLIAYSARDGISVASVGGSNNHWLGNRIVDNGGLGIELGSDGVTANDAGDLDAGPNNLQNHPVLTSAVSAGADTVIAGTLNSNPGTPYRIEFFGAASADASGHGPGAVWLGAASVSTDASGNASFGATLAGVAVSVGHVISAVAVVELGGGTYGDASEFGPAMTVTQPNVAPQITSHGGGTHAGVSVLENSLAVTRVTASDGNLPAQTLVYSIAGGADAARFVIKPTTGDLTFSATPDFEAPADSDSDNVYEVQLQVSDGALVDTQLLSVTVADANEFAVSSPVDADAADNLVAEDAAPGTLIGLTAQATDADGSSHTVSYTLDDNAGGLFSIDAATGQLRVAGPMDAETSRGHVVTVRAWSSDGSSSRASFNVGVQDVDEFDTGAVSDADAAANRVDETAAIGTPVGLAARATDADASNNRISYALDEDADGRFVIDTSSGLVTLARTLGEEGSATHSIVVRAQSTDGSRSTRSFEIDVVPQNNHDPVITSDGGAATARLGVDEGQTLVTVVTAVDADLPAAPLRYSLAGGADVALFAIDTRSGALAFFAAPDHEAPRDADGNGVYDVIVAVSDGAASTTQRLSVSVGDVDEAPVIGRQALLLSEQGVALVLQASDPEGKTHTLVYEVLSTQGGHFELQGGTGRVLQGFTQADVDASRVVFVADSADSNGARSPGFLLALSDGVHRVEGRAAEIVGTLPLPPAATAPAPAAEAAPAAAAPAAAPTAAPTAAPVAASVTAPAATTTEPPPAARSTLVAPEPLALAPLQAAAPVAAAPTADAVDRWRPAATAPAEPVTRPPAPGIDTAFWTAGLADLAPSSNVDTLARESAALELLGSRASSALARAMDASRPSDEQSGAITELGVASTALVSSGLSVGYVLWLARGGVLAASLMSSVPAWASVDPLPVLKHMRKTADGSGDDGLEGDEIDPIDRLFSRARRLLALNAPVPPAPGSATMAAAGDAGQRATARPAAAAGAPQREAEPWVS